MEVVAPEPAWRGQQYVGADRKGRVYVVRPLDSRVYPLRKGSLQRPVKVDAPGVGTPAPVLDAAVRGPRDWVALHGGTVRWIRGGKEVPLPTLNWSAAAVEILDGRPVVAVFPSPVGHHRDREALTVPRLLTPSGDDWRILVRSDREEIPKGEERGDLRISDSVHLFTASDGSLWMAHQYAYRVVRFSGAGEELMELEVDGGQVRRMGEERAEAVRTALERKAGRSPAPERTKLAVNTAVPAVLDLTEGPDGRIYLLTRRAEDGTLQLDRFDRVEARLERASLDLERSGALSMAAGKDGLYLVPFNGLSNRYRVAWEAMEMAEWLPVEDLRIDGFEAPE